MKIEFDNKKKIVRIGIDAEQYGIWSKIFDGYEDQAFFDCDLEESFDCTFYQDDVLNEPYLLEMQFNEKDIFMLSQIGIDNNLLRKAYEMDAYKLDWDHKNDYQCVFCFEVYFDSKEEPKSSFLEAPNQVAIF